MAGSTPVPFDGVSVSFYFSGNGYSSARIVHLTGEHFGIIIFKQHNSNVIKVFILNFVSFQLLNHITFHFIIFISKHPNKRDKYLIHFNFFSFFFILYILFHSIYFSQVKNSIMLPSCNGLYRLTAQLVDAEIANRNCNYSSDRLNWIKVDSLLEWNASLPGFFVWAECLITRLFTC